MLRIAFDRAGSGWRLVRRKAISFRHLAFAKAYYANGVSYFERRTSIATVIESKSADLYIHRRRDVDAIVEVVRVEFSAVEIFSEGCFRLGVESVVFVVLLDVFNFGDGGKHETNM